jgi:hypothetical protein
MTFVNYAPAFCQDLPAYHGREKASRKTLPKNNAWHGGAELHIHKQRNVRMNLSATEFYPRKSAVRSSMGNPIHPWSLILHRFSTPRSPRARALHGAQSGCSCPSSARRKSKILTVESRRWAIAGAWSGHDVPCAEPFAAIELDLALLWDEPPLAAAR